MYIYGTLYCKNGKTSLFRTAIELNWVRHWAEPGPAREPEAVQQYWLLSNASSQNSKHKAQLSSSSQYSVLVVTKTAAQIVSQKLLILQRQWVLTLSLSKNFKKLTWRMQHDFDIMANTSAAPNLTELTSQFFNTTTTTVQPKPIDPPLRTCNYFVINKNTSVVFDFNNHYGGKLFSNLSSYWCRLSATDVLLNWIFFKPRRVISRIFWEFSCLNL